MHTSAAPQSSTSHPPTVSATAPGKPFAPIFVVGCERSGTTLLAVLLGRHSTVAMTPETHFFLRVVPRHTKSREAGGNHAALVRRFMQSPRAQDLNLPEDEILARFARGPATYAALFQVILERFAQHAGKARGAEKTPFHLRKIPLLLEWFPDARIVGIVRDGRDVVLSIMNAPWTAHASLRRQCHKWNRSIALGQRWLNRYPDRYMQIRYKDLVLHTEQTLRDVDAFCGLPFEPAQLDPAQTTHVVPAHEIGWKANAESPPDKSRVGAWQKKVSPHQRLVMNSMMRRSLRALGYGDLQLPSVSVAARIRNALANLSCRVGLYRLWFNTVMRYLPSRRQQRREARFRPGVFESTDSSASSPSTNS